MALSAWLIDVSTGLEQQWEEKKTLSLRSQTSQKDGAHGLVLIRVLFICWQQDMKESMPLCGILCRCVTQMGASALFYALVEK